MALRYKIDILKALKDLGYTTYKLQIARALSNSTVQKLRDGEPLSWANIDKLCTLLDCQPGDLLEYVPDAHDARE